MTYDTIRVLENIEAIQLRPGMYIGSTEHPTHLAVEVIDNAIDEAIGGHTKLVSVLLNKNKSSLSVIDHGRGFPYKSNTGEDAVIASATKLHSGGKFGGDGYVTSSGLHGVGLVAVNALSSYLCISTARNSKFRTYLFENGTYQSTLDNCIPNINDPIIHSGSLVEFSPNPKFFESTVIRESVIVDKLKLAATLLPDIVFKYQDRVISRYSDEDLTGGGSSIPFQHISSGTVDGEEIDIIIGYTDETEIPSYKGSVNLLQVDRGTHINEIIYAIYDAWAPFIQGTILERFDVHCGLRLFVNCKLKSPAYTSQTKECLSIRKDSIVNLKENIRKAITKWLSTSPHKDKLISRFLEYRRALNELSSKKLLDTVIEHGQVNDGVVERRSSGSTKLIDCNSKSREGTELFVIEGDSAGGSLIATRDISKHAILPLRGKILNVVDQPIEYIIKNIEIRSLINAIGAGAFFKQNAEKCRYEKIILATDSDYDGQNILALLIGCLCYVSPEVVELGYVYAAEMPIYGQVDKRGVFRPVYNKQDLDSRWSYEHYKGLGSMDPHQLAKVTFNEDHRRLIQITVNRETIKDVFNIIGTAEGKRRILTEAGLIR